jgi:hypothetical protein
MPFDLHGAPGTFQTLIDKLINVELQPYVFGYMDYIIIVTDTFEKHLDTLEKVLGRLLGAGLVLKRKKCNFCKPELKYLGYIVNRAGLNIDAEKVKVIVDMLRPKDVRGGCKATGRNADVVPKVRAEFRNNRRPPGKPHAERRPVQVVTGVRQGVPQSTERSGASTDSGMPRFRSTVYRTLRRERCWNGCRTHATDKRKRESDTLHFASVL